MKRIVLLISVFLLSACGNNDDTSKEKTNTTSQTSTEISTTSSQTSTSMTESTSQTSESSPQTTETTETETYPYAVDLEELGLVDEDGNQVDKLSDELAFYVEGMNTPLRISINGTGEESPQLYLNIYGYENTANPNLQVSYPFEIENIPTKEITIFGGPGSDEYRRTVKVNTQLTLKKPENILKPESQLSMLEGETFYIFYNNQDSLSLATINFAGNVEPKDYDTMQEYVEE